MSGEIKGRLMRVCDQSALSSTNAEADSGPYLEVNVIFTTPQSTLAALKTADELARNLSARIRFLVPHLVSYPLPLSSPKVSVAFAEQRVSAMARTCREAAEVCVHVYLCRDELRVLLEVLKPQSLVVLGGRRRWWSTPEEKLAGVLGANGHRVIFVEGE